MRHLFSSSSVLRALFEFALVVAACYLADQKRWQEASFWLLVAIYVAIPVKDDD